MFLILAALLLMGPAAPAQVPATQPQPAPGGWSAAAFAYERTGPLLYEETAPNPRQVNFRARPAILADDAIHPTTGDAAIESVTIGPLEITHLKFRSVNGDIVTALLGTPRGKEGPFPLVIAIHGVGSYKAQVLGQVGPALARRGFAVLAPDMPLHGERPGDPRELMQQRNLFRASVLYQQAVVNVRECIDLAEVHPRIDTTQGVFLAGYSMGSWINSIAGPADQRVKAMVLMVGGAVPMGPLLSMVPQAAAVDPMKAIASFAGRPLLLLNAENDRTVTPEMGRRLFGAAAEPKRQVWYRSGHLLPQQAYEDAAAWIAEIRQSIQAPPDPQ